MRLDFPDLTDPMISRGDDSHDLKLIFVKIRITKEICDEIGLP